MLLNLATVRGLDDQKAIVACMHDDNNTMAIVGHIHRVEYPAFMQTPTLYIIDIEGMSAMTFVSEEHAFQYVCTYFRDEIKEYMNTL